MTDLKKINTSISRKEAYEMFACFNALSRLKLSVYIKFDIGHNKNKLKENAELIDAIRTNNDDIEGYEDYQKGLQDISAKHFSNGNGVVEGDAAVVSMNIEVAMFKRQHPKIIEALEQRTKDVEAKIEETIDIEDLIQLKLKDFPKEIEVDITPIISLIER